jgi:DNA-binding GntR family transcriptional regulator
MAPGAIDREAGTVWRQVAADLTARIAAGEFAVRLPGEQYLADEYETSKVTVRKALALLREKGLIETEHGWGSRVVHGGSPPPEGEPP